MTRQQLHWQGSFINSLFYDEPAGTFSHGHILVSEPDLDSAQQDPGVGYWRCDIGRHERLTWSDKVYELFGLAPGATIERDWAIARYSGDSRAALDNVRTYAVGRGYGFILDARIAPDGAADRWIRVLAAPIRARGRVVGLHGLKRAL
jgi:hypothetical protein